MYPPWCLSFGGFGVMHRFFFFQAEDGIRDDLVTGVQTCALPIYACEGRPLPVYGDGMQVRDWIHVEDHCDAIDAALTAGRAGEVYNIGAENERPNLEIGRASCRERV